MNISKESISKVKTALLGALVGAILLAVAGFNWGGWVTAGTAKRMVETTALESVVTALAPICVQNFRQQTDAGAQLANLKSLPSYEQAGFVEKGGWAAALGSDQDRKTIANSCAQALSRLTAEELG